MPYLLEVRSKPGLAREPRFALRFPEIRRASLSRPSFPHSCKEGDLFRTDWGRTLPARRGNPLPRALSRSLAEAAARTPHAGFPAASAEPALRGGSGACLRRIGKGRLCLPRNLSGDGGSVRRRPESLASSWNPAGQGVDP